MSDKLVNPGRHEDSPVFDSSTHIDVKFVSNKIESIKNLLKNLVEEPYGSKHDSDHNPIGFESEQVIAALRSGKPAAEVYTILSQYAISNAVEPIIFTDKGKVLYIDYNIELNRIFLYIGNREDYLSLDTSVQKQIWVLPFCEKYEYKKDALTGHVFRTLMKPEEILMTHADDMALKGTYIPLLFIHIYEAASGETAKCHERIEWIPGKIQINTEAKREDRFIDKLLASVATNCFPVTGKNANAGSGVRQLLSNKLKPAVDPRDKSDKDNSLLIA